MDLLTVFKQGDGVLIATFLILVIMSIVTWTLIATRTSKLLKAKKANKASAITLWHAANWDEATQKLADHESPIARIALNTMKTKARYTSGGATVLGAQVPMSDLLTRAIRNGLNKEMSQFDHGLTALASIGATAPFIGLFGTVWGIYHALINISTSGQMSIAAVAGPIGEALVATAAGLFVAIPAVLAYNALSRGKKTMSQDLDSFAYDLHAQLLNNEKVKEH